MLLILFLQDAMTGTDLAVWLLLLFGGGVFYLLPAIIANKHPNGTAIFWLNVLLGWTLIGWIVALIWVLTTPSSRVVVQQPAPRPSIADELQKLQALRDGGTITAAEFDQQKARLLA